MYSEQKLKLNRSTYRERPTTYGAKHKIVRGHGTLRKRYEPLPNAKCKGDNRDRIGGEQMVVQKWGATWVQKALATTCWAQPADTPGIQQADELYDKGLEKLIGFTPSAGVKVMETSRPFFAKYFKAQIIAVIMATIGVSGGGLIASNAWWFGGALAGGGGVGALVRRYTKAAMQSYDARIQQIKELPDQDRVFDDKDYIEWMSKNGLQKKPEQALQEGGVDEENQDAAANAPRGRQSSIII